MTNTSCSHSRNKPNPKLASRDGTRRPEITVISDGLRHSRASRWYLSTSLRCVRSRTKSIFLTSTKPWQVLSRPPAPMFLSAPCHLRHQRNASVFTYVRNLRNTTLPSFKFTQDLNTQQYHFGTITNQVYRPTQSGVPWPLHPGDFARPILEL